jgi:hypothetical protein
MSELSDWKRCFLPGELAQARAAGKAEGIAEACAELEKRIGELATSFEERAADQGMLANQHALPTERPFCAERATIWRTAALEIRSLLARHSSSLNEPGNGRSE